MQGITNLVRRAGQYIIKFIVLGTLKINIRGKENISDIPKALIVSNHESYLDVFVLGHPFFKYGLKLRWVISKANYRLWYLKWLYFLWPVIPVNGTVEKIKKAFEKDLWVVIFPEGDQRWCHPVEVSKKRPGRGAAVVALSTGVPIIPVGISGAKKVLPIHSFHLDRHYEITVSVGKPFRYDVVEESKISDDLLNLTIEDMKTKVKSLVEDLS